MLSGALYTVDVNWYTFLYREKTSIIVPKILEAAVNIGARTTRRPRSVHPCF